MLTFTYDITLVAASLAISLMASFTGLTVTNGISALSIPKRKTAIGMAAIVIGGGIWSMHFVAILALELPVPIAYDPKLTLASILIAILMAGTALLLLHFAKRSTVNMIVAGAILGNGILTMHVIGMLGIRGCTVEFGLPGHALAAVLATGTGVLAIWVGYKKRTRTNVFFATLIFGLSVVVVHFTAMLGTGFMRLPPDSPPLPSMGDANLALIVIVAAFLICGGFLLSAATFLVAGPGEPALRGGATTGAGPVETGADGSGEDAPPPDPLQTTVRVPYECDRRTHFMQLKDIAAIRAEGHYTILYSREDKHFCPWSISDSERRLPARTFIRTHRSYLVNIDHVSGFERRKDNGTCLLDGVASLNAVPVSRARVDSVREALGI